MMSKMLIDARHPEETRVVVSKGNRLEDFDFESANKKQLKGNIYLAKVTRVEPSLQAAFVEYGGNRHGFLAFSEIHPDYYQIPHEDREALLRAEQASHEEVDSYTDRRRKRRRFHGPRNAEKAVALDEAAEPAEALPVAVLSGDDEHSPAAEGMISNTIVEDDEDLAEGDAADVLLESHEDEQQDGDLDDEGDHDAPEGREGADEDEEDLDVIEAGATEEVAEDAARRRRALVRRHYKIQEVIKRRQILLVQVVKEERGGKGAALTTYLSLAGRYCVLMPNTTHGGGISRKISSGEDRQRLKEIMDEMDLPRGMGCIIRTAGLKRSKVEIKRDFDYLTRVWDGIRDTTLTSVAPALIYEDSSLIKRAIRDLYTKDVEEILIDGEESYRIAKEYMRLLMPSHAKRVQIYKDHTPLFQRFSIEAQLETLYHPTVQLKSGGYIVINPTEALVSIDINSGRATREHNIEETALKTNCEAADEIARQLRLRDMAGLVVIDFIDMESNSHIRQVERRLKEALKNDRARIQIGRISNFGLMEMSRQRLRTGVLEASTHECPTCRGTGFVRSQASAALHALRGLEDEAAKLRASHLTLCVAPDIAIYILNKKRVEIAHIEDRYGVLVEVMPKPDVIIPDFEINRSGSGPVRPLKVVESAHPEIDEDPDLDEDDVEAEDETSDDVTAEPVAAERGAGGRHRQRRHRRSERGSNAAETDQDPRPASAEARPAADSEDDEGSRRRRRRGRRGGRRHREGAPGAAVHAAEGAAEAPVKELSLVGAAEPENRTPPAALSAGIVRETPFRPSVHVQQAPPSFPVSAPAPAPASAPVPAPAPALPEGVVIDASEASSEEDAQKRKGWWQRTFG